MNTTNMQKQKKRFIMAKLSDEIMVGSCIIFIARIGYVDTEEEAEAYNLSTEKAAAGKILFLSFNSDEKEVETFAKRRFLDVCESIILGNFYKEAW